MAYAIPPFEIHLERIGCDLSFEGEQPDPVGDGSWSFEDQALPEVIEFDVNAELHDDWLDLLSPSEQKSPDVAIRATILCKQIRKSFSITLSEAGGTWEGSFSVPTADLFGQLDIVVYLVRMSDSKSPESGYASKRGSVIATSPQCQVILQPGADSKGGDLKTQWETFDKLGSPASRFLDAVYYLDLIQDPPVLYLNQLLPGALRHVLSVDKTRGPQAMIRDAFMMPIVADVWEQLATHVLHQLAAVGDLEALKEWESGVLNAVASDLADKTTLEDSRKELSSICEDEDSLAELIEKRLPMYVQVKANLAGSFTKVAEKQ